MTAVRLATDSCVATPAEEEEEEKGEEEEMEEEDDWIDFSSLPSPFLVRWLARVGRGGENSGVQEELDVDGTTGEECGRRRFFFPASRVTRR